MRDEPSTLTGRGGVFADPEHDVLTNGLGACSHGACALSCAVIGVHAHATEVTLEAQLEKRALVWIVLRSLSMHAAHWRWIPLHAAHVRWIAAMR